MRGKLPHRSTTLFLHSLVNTKNEELNNTYAQLKVRYMDTIEVLRLTVDAKKTNIRAAILTGSQIMR